MFEGMQIWLLIALILRIILWEYLLGLVLSFLRVLLSMLFAFIIYIL